MTRKHFQALADALKGARTCWAEHEADDYPNFPKDGCPEQEQWRRAVRAVGDACYAANGRFDRGRFERAAGFDR
jgi:hypothetical protein